MNRRTNFRAVIVSIVLTALALPIAFTTPAAAQTADTHIAVQRGYRTGYSDGYMSGYRDIIDSLSRDMSRHNEYGQADRAYSKDYGSIEEYRDGYRQGFEAGYATGFDRKSYESTLPADLKLKGVV